jgi:hypothetical protein
MEQYIEVSKKTNDSNNYQTRVRIHWILWKQGEAVIKVVTRVIARVVRRTLQGPWWTECYHMHECKDPDDK